MSKAVLISIQPKWCELIAKGIKTVEVRKTKPKLEAPFKCYIYCTKESYKGKYLHTSNQHGKLLFWHNPNDTIITVQPEEYDYTAYACGGKVVGEFVCDKVIKTCGWRLRGNTQQCAKRTTDEEAFPELACLTIDEIVKYAGSENREVCGWHISDLKIYDKPKELSEFFTPMGKRPSYMVERPPQSYMYVEEL